jgi:hypothetical protein
MNDPSEPTHFVLSWAGDVTGGREMAAVFFLVMGPVFLPGAALYARPRLRRLPGAPPVAPGAAG